MSDNITANLALPLLMPAQAQKHVTVNDALIRLDGLADLLLQSVDQSNPPETIVEGMCWAVPSSATGAWAGKAGQIAIAMNGGWEFVTPRVGRRAFVLDQGVQAIHDGQGWVIGALSLGGHGSGLMARQSSIDVTLTAGNSIPTGLYIPTGAMVIGVTARVLEEISGTLASWRVGTVGALNRFGQELGKEQGSWGRGIMSAPMTYWDVTEVLLTSTGGKFAAGKVRLVAHWLELRMPD